ncbi:P-loop containing nucleoside triphosphate hydrolase protein [Phascolomyces articulosus]|uniref:RNA helicase n=1 Tax=Phascolomyces articulosus TaxID=60185 RepID=A0AAD5JXB4_9FUNG|nr:P-loop containing nucleoside triphosphate hydrolase protein [Phascolomyces articulosus]
MPKKKKATYKNSMARGFAVIGSATPKPTQDTATLATASQPTETNDSSDVFGTTTTTTTVHEENIPAAIAIEPPLITKSKVTTSPPLDHPETEADMVLRLAKRFGSVNDRKSITLFNELSQSASEEGKVRPFALTADIEYDLLQVLRHQGCLDTFAAAKRLGRNNAQRLDRDRFIGQMDVTHRALVKMGFESDDVDQAFKATISSNATDLLDWLCVHLPYERMPVGFFDKYFTEEGLSIRADIATGNKKTDRENTRHTETQTPSSDIKFQRERVKQDAANDDDDFKARILRAAQQQYDEEEDEEDEDVNEKHAKYKVEISELEDKIPSSSGKSKKKKNKIQEDGINVEEIRAKIEKLRKSIRDLEADWDFDKRRAQLLFAEEQKKAIERCRLENEQMRQKQREEERMKKAAEEEKAVVEDDDPLDFGLGLGGEDEDEGGFFGALMDEDIEETAAIPTSTTITYNIIDTATPGWKGRYSKDMLDDYCKRNGGLKASYTKNEISRTCWRAVVKIISTQKQSEAKSYELPLDIAAKTKEGAEQLVATRCLFELDSESAVYKIMPALFKDLWLEWLDEKNKREEEQRIEADRKRMQLFLDLVGESHGREKTLGSFDTLKETESLNDGEGASNDNKNKATKRKQTFARVKNNFQKRLKTDDYLKMKKKREELPMTSYRDQVLELVKGHQVVIISGETGCGKSTQVPQFIAEYLLQGPSTTGSVICTQPRRISAVSIAKRVSQEMGDWSRSLGTKNGMVGYQIRLESKVAEENVLVFCTTGILLRRLESDKTLEGVTHVIVDEVHERTIESDFLLVILRQLCSIRPDLRIILMSATVEAHKFSEYFGYCPVISVPGRTFPVQVQYLEDVIEATGYTLEEDSPYALRRQRIRRDHGNIDVTGKHGASRRVRLDWFEEDTDDDDPYDPTTVESKLTTVSRSESPATVVEKLNDEENPQEEKEESAKYSKQTRKMIRRIDQDRINYDLILDLIDYVCIRSREQETTTSKQVPKTGAILVFLPGMPEIRRLYDLISAHHVLGDAKKFVLIALHSTLSSEHQEKAFDVPPEGMRKIVLSTNIAETGVTISDVTIVIDTGMAKIVSYDKKKRITRLRQMFVAKANARQRRGRAGRVQEGLCFHLFTENKFSQMADYETPEIMRLPLEELCLRIKVCDLGPIKEVLDSALDAPSSDLVDNAIQTLKEVQALSLDDSQTLTSLGAHLANLPVDVHIGKMILFGALFRCLDPVLTIAAALSFKSPFIRPFGKETEADVARAKFRYADSDFWTIYRAYDTWRSQFQHLLQQKSGWRRKIREFCQKNYLSHDNLEMIEDMKRQYLGLLISIGFVKAEDASDLVERYELKRQTKWCKVPPACNVYARSVPVVNAAIMAGLYPKLAERDNEVFHNNKLSGMQIHPSSMLFGRQRMLSSDFLVYNTVVMNGEKIFMWEATTIDPVAIMLLAADLEIKHKQRRVILDGWMKFDCFARSAALLKFLRTELNNWLTAKMHSPDLDLTHYSEEIMDVMVKTLESQVD